MKEEKHDFEVMEDGGGAETVQGEQVEEEGETKEEEAKEFDEVTADEPFKGRTLGSEY